MEKFPEVLYVFNSVSTFCTLYIQYYWQGGIVKLHNQKNCPGVREG